LAIADEMPLFSGVSVAEDGENFTKVRESSIQKIVDMSGSGASDISCTPIRSEKMTADKAIETNFATWDLDDIADVLQALDPPPYSMSDEATVSTLNCPTDSIQPPPVAASDVYFVGHYKNEPVALCSHCCSSGDAVYLQSVLTLLCVHVT